MDLYSKLSNVPFIGYILVASISVLTITVSFIVKVLDSCDPFLLACIRSFVILILASFRILVAGLSPFPTKRITVKLFFRGFLGSLGVLGRYYATRHMALGDFTVMFTSVPIFQTFLARLFLNEPCGVFEVMSMASTLGGIIIILRPAPLFGEEFGSMDISDHHHNAYLGVIAAIVSVFGQSVSGVLDRSLKEVPVSIITWWSGFASSISAFIACFILGVDVYGLLLRDLGYAILIGMIAYLAVNLNGLSYRFENAGFTSLLKRAFDVVLGYAVQVIYFGDVPSILTDIGVCIITGTVIFSGIRKVIQKNMYWSFAIRKYIFCIPEKEEVSSMVEKGDPISTEKKTELNSIKR